MEQPQNFLNEFVTNIINTANPKFDRLYFLGGIYNISIKSLEHKGNNTIIIEETESGKFIPVPGIPYVLSYKNVFYIMHFTEIIIDNKMYFIIDGAQNASTRNNQNSESEGLVDGVSK